MIKYIVLPGHVHSKYDGELHYVAPSQLMDLYGVDRSECLIVPLGKPENLRGIKPEDYYWLIPKYDGDYSLPTKKGYKDGKN